MYRESGIIKENDYDVVFIDIIMPKMDGIDTLKAIKAEKPDTVAIMMSAYAVEGDVKKALQMSAFDYLYKPFNKNDVDAVFNKIRERDRLKSPPSDYIARSRRKFIPLAPHTKKAFQLKYVKLIVLSCVVPMMLVGIGFYSIFNVILNKADLGRYAEAVLGDVFLWLNLLLGLVLIISIIVAVWLALRLSHPLPALHTPPSPDDDLPLLHHLKCFGEALLRCAQHARADHPDARLVVGGAGVEAGQDAHLRHLAHVDPQRRALGLDH